jgi:RNA polymerase sigma-70 factor (ECF subfamily)
MLSRTSTSLLEGLIDPRNEAAWRRFVARYTPMLLSFARRVGLSDADAQDAVAETLATFVRLYTSGHYERERGRLKAWLAGIMGNQVRRMNDRRRTISLDEQPAPEVGSAPAALDEYADAFDHEWELQQLAEALQILRRTIDPTAYQAFDLYALKDWRPTKVAEFLGMTVNHVYVNKCRCLRELREIVRRLAEGGVE